MWRTSSAPIRSADLCSSPQREQLPGTSSVCSCWRRRWVWSALHGREPFGFFTFASIYKIVSYSNILCVLHASYH